MSLLSFSAGLRCAAGEERLHALLEDTAVQENATFAGKTANPNIRAETHHFPIVTPAGMRLSEANDVA
jgi:hypothetical protein